MTLHAINTKAEQTRHRAAATAELLTLRNRYTLQGLDVRVLREEGRA